MEGAQRELLCILLGHIQTLGFISKSTYSGAADLVQSEMDLPEFFRYPVCLTKEADADEHTQNTE